MQFENVFDGESSYDFSIAREILDKPNDAATNTDDTLTNLSDAPAPLAEPVEMQVFSGMILKDSNHKNIFRVDNIDNNDDTIIDDENEKIEELRELRVSTSYGLEDYNAIALQGFWDHILSPGQSDLDLPRVCHAAPSGFVTPEKFRCPLPTVNPFLKTD